MEQAEIIDTFGTYQGAEPIIKHNAPSGSCNKLLGQSKSEAEASYLTFTVLDVERNKNGLKYYLLFAFFFYRDGFSLV